MNPQIYKYLKAEERLCDEIWDTERGNLSHAHKCDFEILALGKNQKQRHERAVRACKKYLKGIGKKRDYNLCCCDECIHMRYLTISEDEPGLILNIATLALDLKEG